jgi:hypothetical protein
VAKPTKLLLVVLAALLITSVAIVTMVLSVRDSGTATHSQEASASSVAPTGSSAIAVTDARTGQVTEHRAAERAAMLAAIARAREARTQRNVAPTRLPATPGAPTTTGDSTATTLDITDRTGDTSDWQKRALGTLNKLLGQCYDLGRAEDGNLAGTVVLRFTLVGEPGVGGLLERVEIVDANTTITQQTIRDCFTQQLYALELDPPPDGVTVERELSLNVP